MSILRFAVRLGWGQAQKRAFLTRPHYFGVRFLGKVGGDFAKTRPLYSGDGFKGESCKAKVATWLPRSAGPATKVKGGISMSRGYDGSEIDDFRHSGRDPNSSGERGRGSGTDWQTRTSITLQQQARFDKFIEIFNKERPHEALAMKCPADVYAASTRPHQGLPDIDYPFRDRTTVVTHCGRICLGKKKINFSTVFAGQAVGIKEVQDDIWLVSFMGYNLRYFDLETRVLEPFENPFGPKVLPM
jgi:hypothetical protein